MATNVTLAHKWDEDKVNPAGYWISEKLDGVRAYWDGQKFYSRAGNEFYAPEFFKKGLPKQPLDGELWTGRGKFAEAISIVKTHNAGKRWEFIKYYVFDAVIDNKTCEERTEYVKKTITPQTTPYAEWVGSIKCKGKQHLMEELAKVEKKGGEGLMLRKPNSKYEKGRSHCLLKVKTFNDEEAIVTEIKEGTGKHSHRMGAIMVKTPDGRVFKVGSGFTDAQRDKPPKVGSIITYKYQELSNKLTPRFPTYVGPRIDLNWNDYCKTYTPPTSASTPHQLNPVLTKDNSILYSAPPSKRRSTDKMDDDKGDDDDSCGKAQKKAKTNPQPKEKCKYGANCFRKNKRHLEEFCHPSDPNVTDDDTNDDTNDDTDECDNTIYTRLVLKPTKDRASFNNNLEFDLKQYAILGRNEKLSDSRISRKHISFEFNNDRKKLIAKSLGLARSELRSGSSKKFNAMEKGEMVDLNAGDILRILPSVPASEYEVVLYEL